MKDFEFSDEHKRKFSEDGCLIIRDFLSSEECDELRKECLEIIENIDPENQKAIFSTNDHEQMNDDYLISTTGKIGFFWEVNAFDEAGNLKYPKNLSLNKMGHAFHTLSEPYRKITFSEKIKNILRKLDFVRPVIPQSMYIFKPPQIGGSVNRHIDATFLFSNPLKLIGFWIALEDATLENGCLKFVKGSHKTKRVCFGPATDGAFSASATHYMSVTSISQYFLGSRADVSMRMVRNPVKGAAPSLVFEGSLEFLPFSDFEAAPVSKGSLVLIDGKVQHCSDKNSSKKSRNIYTFHVVESYKTEWCSRNWLQPCEGNNFPAVYDDSFHHK